MAWRPASSSATAEELLINCTVIANTISAMFMPRSRRNATRMTPSKIVSGEWSKKRRAWSGKTSSVCEVQFE
ncbi:hypothetical protein DID88_004932 [Monilinia fructigena]|uniref:Uncharacterized protein n=1 Tax=Monilinia fructigena TaxID=38457 RepID=A0A395IQL6_9HELO|nr:hypothetical protein DID88_004932 [Monilinia fructigena]